MDDWSRGEILALFSLVVAIIGLIITSFKLQSGWQKNIALLITAAVSVVLVLWLVKSLNKKDIGKLSPPEPSYPSPSVSPPPSPSPLPTPKLSPMPGAIPSSTQKPTPVPSPVPKPTLTPTPISRPLQETQEPANTRRSGMVTLTFTLLDQSIPVTGARVEFTAGGFSRTAYTSNGRATATVPCGVPGMWINIEYQGMRNSAPIRRGLKCQSCHYEAGPIDIGVTGVQCLVVSCGGNRTGCY